MILSNLKDTLYNKQLSSYEPGLLRVQQRVVRQKRHCPIYAKQYPSVAFIIGPWKMSVDKSLQKYRLTKVIVLSHRQENIYEVVYLCTMNQKA